MHEVRYDAAAALLRIRMAGFWTLADVRRFAADLRAIVVPMPESHRGFDMLTDSTDFPVQSREVTDGLAQIIEVTDQMEKPGRRAIVVGSVMSKLQAERVLAGPHVRVFLAETEPQAWLAASREDAA